MSQISESLGLTPIQEMQVVHNYFTLEQWKLIAKGLNHLLVTYPPHDIPTRDIMEILVKCPSAAQ